MALVRLDFRVRMNRRGGPESGTPSLRSPGESFSAKRCAQLPGAGPPASTCILSTQYRDHSRQRPCRIASASSAAGSSTGCGDRSVIGCNALRRRNAQVLCRQRSVLQLDVLAGVTSTPGRRGWVGHHRWRRIRNGASLLLRSKRPLLGARQVCRQSLSLLRRRARGCAAS